MAKLAIRQGKVKLSTLVSFPNFKTSSCKEHVERYELDAKLSPIESLRLSFDGKSKASKIKVTRKLDPKNRIDAEYNYTSASLKYASLTFKHYYSKVHTFGINANYGSRKYRAEWECNTENGPWTVSTSFPFNARCVYCRACFVLFCVSQYLFRFSLTFHFVYARFPFAQPAQRRLANQASFRVLDLLFLHHMVFVF